MRDNRAHETHWLHVWQIYYFLGFVFSSSLRRNSTLQVFSNSQMTSLKTIPVDRTRNYVAPKITAGRSEHEIISGVGTICDLRPH